MKFDLCILTMLAQIEAPMAAVNHEYLSRIVAMLRIHTARRLPGTADIITMRLCNMDMLVRVFGNTWANDGEIFLRL